MNVNAWNELQNHVACIGESHAVALVGDDVVNLGGDCEDGLHEIAAIRVVVLLEVDINYGQRSGKRELLVFVEVLLVEDGLVCGFGSDCERLDEREDEKAGEEGDGCDESAHCFVWFSGCAR